MKKIKTKMNMIKKFYVKGSVPFDEM